jgi:hypothetical protein
LIDVGTFGQQQLRHFYMDSHEEWRSTLIAALNVVTISTMRGVRAVAGVG